MTLKRIPVFPHTPAARPALGGSDGECVCRFTPFIPISPSPVRPPAFPTSFTVKASSWQSAQY